MYISISWNLHVRAWTLLLQGRIQHTSNLNVTSSRRNYHRNCTWTRVVGVGARTLSWKSGDRACGCRDLAHNAKKKSTNRCHLCQWFPDFRCSFSNASGLFLFPIARFVPGTDTWARAKVSACCSNWLNDSPILNVDQLPEHAFCR